MYVIWGSAVVEEGGHEPIIKFMWSYIFEKGVALDSVTISGQFQGRSWTRESRVVTVSVRSQDPDC